MPHKVNYPSGRAKGMDSQGLRFRSRLLAGFPGANIKEFLVTILSEAKWPQIKCLNLKGTVWG